MGGVGDRLVRAGIQGADDHGTLGAEHGQDGGVLVSLLLDGRLDRGVEEAELGAEQARPLDGTSGGRSRRLAVADVGEQLDPGAVPGRRRAGPGVDLLPELAVRGNPIGRGSDLGVDLDRSGSPVDEDGRPLRRLVSTPVTPTTQGMPSCLEMIAVWLVGPPFSVTSAAISPASSPAVSAGARSSATSTDGAAGVGTPGSGAPTIRATRRFSTSRRSVTRSAISPPSWVKTPTNCSMAARRAGSSASPSRRLVATAPRSPLSRARPAVA